LLVELVSTTPAKTPATITAKTTAPGRLRWWIFQQLSPGEQIRSRSIKHGTSQDTDRNHYQDGSTGPPLLVELATASSKVPATTRATAPARSRWWSWPLNRARHRPRLGRRHRPALLVELPATITRPTDQGATSSTASTTITGNDYDQGNSTGHDHDQGDATGPAPLVELATWPLDRTQHRPRH
jgi:hypothetical protein